MSCHRIISNIKLGLITAWIFCVGVLFCVILSPILLYRWLLIKLCNVVRSYTHIVSPGGHSFMTGSPSNVQISIYANVLITFKIRGGLSFETCKELFASRLIYAKSSRNTALYPEFQQYWEYWGGFYFWKQEVAFSIDEHMRLYKNSSGRKLKANELVAIEEEYIKTEFSLDKSPWEILVVDNTQILNENGEEDPWSIVLFKFHHSLADGYAIFNALLKCADEPCPLKLQTESQQQQFNTSGLKFWLSFPFLLALEFAKVSRFIDDVQPISAWESLSPDIGYTNAKQQLIAGPYGLNFDRVKDIATKYSVSVTTVLLAAATGGLRNYLLNKSCKLPQDLVVVVPVPIPNHPEGLVNSFCLIDLKLPIGTENLEDRLTLIEKNVDGKKNNPMEPILTNLKLTLAGLLPKCIYSRIPWPKCAQVCLTIFPGPLQPIKFNRQELFELTFNQLSSSPLFYLCILSCANQLQIISSGDFRCFSKHDLTQLHEHIANEFSVMESEKAINDGEVNLENEATSFMVA